MDDYKFQQRRKKRGGHCLIAYTDPITNVGKSCLCGCGGRSQLPKKYKKRVVKRTLQKLMWKELNK